MTTTFNLFFRPKISGQQIFLYFMLCLCVYSYINTNTHTQIYVYMPHKKHELVFLTGVTKSGKLSEKTPNILTAD